MSTRLRPIVVLAGEPKAGGQARLALEMWMRSLHIPVPPRGSMPEDRRLVSMFMALPSRELGGSSFLWVFREPRRVAPTRSRYAQLCQHYGIGPYKTKKKKASQFLGELLRDPLMERVQRRAAEAEQAMRDAQNLSPLGGQLNPGWVTAPMATTTAGWINAWANQAPAQGINNQFGFEQGAIPAPAPPTTPTFSVQIQDTPVFRDWDFETEIEP